MNKFRYEISNCHGENLHGEIDLDNVFAIYKSEICSDEVLLVVYLDGDIELIDSDVDSETTKCHYRMSGVLDEIEPLYKEGMIL